ncbi:MAG: D-alanine--D-alanine ligase family protein [Anaerolineae bacterium]
MSETSDQTPPRRLRVGVLFGGRSAEHEVSLASARAVMDNLAGDDVEIVPIGITREGRWIAGGDPWRALSDGTSEGSAPVALLPDPSQQGGLMRLERGGDSLAANGSPRLAGLDVIFPVLHGTYGEDGTVQGLLEMADVAYVGCGVMASSVGMDKAMMKAVFAAVGLPVVPYLMVMRARWETTPDTVVQQIEAALRYPMFVKPANSGSSVGISKVHHAGELRPALALAASYDRKIVVEQGIDAREIEVSVLGNDEPDVSLPGEIIPAREWYDYDAKYVDDETCLILPARLPQATTDEIRRLAALAFKAIDASGLSRVDFLLDRQTGELWLSEINTMPGFTPMSMYARMWEASGVSYAEVCRRLVRLAVERHSDRQRNRTDRE